MRLRPPEHGPALAWCLLPWIAFEGGLLGAVALVDHAELSWRGWLAGAPFSVVFVAGPSLAPMVAPRRGWVGWIALALMTAVALAAGVAIAVSDDAQAGLAVLWVTYAALPLAGLIWAVQRYADDRRARRSPSADRR